MCRGCATAAAGGTRRCREQPRGLRFAGCGLLASSPAAAARWPRGGPRPGPGRAERSRGPGGSAEPGACGLLSGVPRGRVSPSVGSRGLRAACRATCPLATPPGPELPAALAAPLQDTQVLVTEPGRGFLPPGVSELPATAKPGSDLDCSLWVLLQYKSRGR